MRVSVFGLGYVGSVSAASFAADGHEVIGVDVNPGKVESLNAGRSPIVEPGLDELIRSTREDGRLRATTDTGGGRARDRCVAALRGHAEPQERQPRPLVPRTRQRADRRRPFGTKPSYHVVVVRSTVLPGTTHEVVIPALERRRARSTARSSASR